MEMNCEEYKGPEDFGNDNRPAPGRYHVVVKSADEFHPKYAGKVVIEYEVLAGTTPGQENRKHTEYFATSKAAMPRLIKMGLAAGLISYGERKNVAWADAVGRQLVIDLEEHDYEKEVNGKKETRKGVRISWVGMHALGDDAAKDVPKNEQAVELARKLHGGIQAAPPKENGSNSANGNATPVQPAKAAASWDDL